MRILNLYCPMRQPLPTHYLLLCAWNVTSATCLKDSYFGYIGLKYIIKINFTCFLLFKTWLLQNLKVTAAYIVFLLDTAVLNYTVWVIKMQREVRRWLPRKSRWSVSLKGVESEEWELGSGVVFGREPMLGFQGSGCRSSISFHGWKSQDDINL